MRVDPLPEYADDGWVEFSVGEALAYGWNRLWGNALVWLSLMLLCVLIGGVFEYVGNGFEFSDARGVVWSGSYAPGAVGALLLSSIVNWLMAAMLTRGALDETRGEKATYSGIVRLDNVVAVLLASLLVAAGATVGTLLLLIPGLVFAFLAYYTIPYALDQGQDAWSAFRSSVALVSANVGRLLMLALAVIALNVVGALLCGIGLLVTMPMTLIATTYAFRVLQGERVA